MVRVPEGRRDHRHQVRTRLAWAGFGSLGQGSGLGSGLGTGLGSTLGAEPCELPEHQGCPQHIGQGGGFVVSQCDRIATGVRVIRIENRQVAFAGAMRDDADLAALRGEDIVPHPNAGQVYSLDSDSHGERVSAAV